MNDNNGVVELQPHWSIYMHCWLILLVIKQWNLVILILDLALIS